MDELEEFASKLLAEAEANHTFDMAPLSPILKPQRKRVAETEHSDPENMMHLHWMFARWMKHQGLPQPVSDPTHTCCLSKCHMFRRGSYFVCSKTGRMHHCTLESCSEKRPPPAIQLANGTILRQVDRLMCTITGEIYEVDPQLDFHEESMVRSGLQEEKESVEEGVAVTLSSAARSKQKKQKSQPGKTLQTLVRTTLDEILMPSKKSEWVKFSQHLTLRVASLVRTIIKRDESQRYFVVATLYALSRSMTQLDDVVLAAYPRLSEWITPMGDLVNRNQSYSWLAPTYSLVKALGVAEAWLDCVHIRNQPLGAQRTEAIAPYPELPPLGHVNITTIIPSNQCTTGCGDPVSFREAIVSHEHRVRCIIRHIPFVDQHDPCSKWSQWDEKVAFSNQVFVSAHPLIDNTDTDRAMLQAMHPLSFNYFPEPPPPLAPPPSADPAEEQQRQVILAQIAEFESRYDLESYRFWYDQWHRMAQAGRLQRIDDWEKARIGLFHCFTQAEMLETTRSLHASNTLACNQILSRILDLVYKLRADGSITQREKVFNLRHTRPSVPMQS